MRVTSIAQWLAASAAGLTELEYVAFGDDLHGDIVAKFVDDVLSLPPSRRTVSLLQCQRLSRATFCLAISFHFAVRPALPQPARSHEPRRRSPL